MSKTAPSLLITFWAINFSSRFGKAGSPQSLGSSAQPDGCPMPLLGWGQAPIPPNKVDPAMPEGFG
jgi:hypothetical protein